MKKNYNNQKNSSFILSFIAIFLVVVAFGGIFMNFSNIKDIFKKLSEDEPPVETPVEDSTDENTDELVKQLYCQYDTTISFESAVGGLKIFIPTYNGYINYNFIHSKNTSSNCDMWRLGQAFAFDDDLKNSYEITTHGAEWDMALRIVGRDDFIGGYAHGDEKFTSLTFFIDGVQKDITSITKLTSFDELTILETSVGYDPADHTTKSLIHRKEFLIDEQGIVLNQRVEWLQDYSLSDGYLAMMPPKKIYTDRYYTDKNFSPAVIDFALHNNVSRAVLYGTTSNLSFEMSFSVQQSLNDSNIFQIHDNGGGAYNKMYFDFTSGGDVSKGDVWETFTDYKIEKK